LNAFLESADHITNSYSISKLTCKLSNWNFLLASEQEPRKGTSPADHSRQKSCSF